ncbi:hypothetical protein TRL7639_01754 [Falsiruegeria litorea R37]|uniref:DUF2852 domain-containing protein n=1 Tax=Falsiruegeria litorea R37 TaxID=1200284 RepID=A0A1Y5SFA2_9RHOB|nr:DUF2852 domain-containing protein [Falsiruegeria litorea]SLN36343.1 hypothetical protein TRL7639_01754 [Falsiruegeria litorea R37]
MTSMTDPVATPSNPGWLRRSEAWLDRKGSVAWYAAMILGFVVFWPIGLALLLHMIWSDRMYSKSWSDCSYSRKSKSRNTMRQTGNTAFDSYKADTLARLEQEQVDFEAFLERLREAKDKSEFDQFMNDRAREAANDDDKKDDVA